MIKTKVTKIEYLINNGLMHGDRVSFKVENQYSGCYVGPLDGMLVFLDNGDAIIESIHNGKKVFTTINEGYDAYIGSISRIFDYFDLAYINYLKCKKNGMELNNHEVK